MFACIHSPQAEGLSELANSFSPWVEQTAPETVLFSIDGLGSLIGDARAVARAIQKRATFPCTIAIAAAPDTAVLAARHLTGVVVIPPGQEVRYLGSLSIECLPLDVETFDIFDRWGIRALEDLACLPENGLQARLGEAGARLHRLARGVLGRPLKPVLQETLYAEQIELEHPLELLEPLLFLVARFLNELCARLQGASLAAGELYLRLNQQERALRLPFPTRDTKFLLRLLQHDLEAHPPGEPVETIALRITPAEPRLVQNDLFMPAAPEPERLELTLAKIRGMVGANNVKTPELRDTWRPGWGPAESRLAFRHFRPPLEARVETEAAGRPRQVRARGVQGEVLDAAGPWRTSGDWWRSDAWDRDEWDVALSDGALYRVCWDGKRRVWMVEGSYD